MKTEKMTKIVDAACKAVSESIDGLLNGPDVEGMTGARISMYCNEVKLFDKHSGHSFGVPQRTVVEQIMGEDKVKLVYETYAPNEDLHVVCKDETGYREEFFCGQLDIEAYMSGHYGVYRRQRMISQIKFLEEGVIYAAPQGSEVVKTVGQLISLLN